jgi:hypothetical protein
MRRATLAAFALGLLVGMGCGAAKVLPEPTTILVKVHLVASQDIDQLFITGTVNGFDEIPRTYLPPDSGMPFNGPQSFRIFLPDSDDGKNLEVDVFGVTQGNPVAAGTATVTVIKQHEVEADIDLSPNSDGGMGGGAGGGSGTGGGAMGGGAGTGGGGGMVGSCTCDGGCCANGQNTCLEPKLVSLTRLPSGGFIADDCGPSEMACTDFCDPVKAVSCTAGKCTCGPALICRVGQRCEVTGTAPNLAFACRCDFASGCQGCCQNDGTCLPLAAEDGGHCGAAGNQCEQCNGGSTAGSCANGSGVCAAMTDICSSGKCASGNDCVDVQFPTCVAPLNNRCTACDPVRANHCSALAGATSEGCACGTKSECPAGQYCDNNFNCQPLF